jgi:hypothetical protein
VKKPRPFFISFGFREGTDLSESRAQTLLLLRGTAPQIWPPV